MFKRRALNREQPIKLNRVVEFRKEIKLKDIDCVIRQYAYAIFKQRAKQGRYDVLFLTGDYAGRMYLNVCVPLRIIENGRSKIYYETLKLGKYKFVERHGEHLEYLPFHSGCSYRIYSLLGIDFGQKTILLEELNKLADQKNQIEIERETRRQMTTTDKEL